MVRDQEAGLSSRKSKHGRPFRTTGRKVTTPNYGNFFQKGIILEREVLWYGKLLKDLMPGSNQLKEWLQFCCVDSLWTSLPAQVGAQSQCLLYYFCATSSIVSYLEATRVPRRIKNISSKDIQSRSVLHSSVTLVIASPQYVRTAFMSRQRKKVKAIVNF